jgi:hypothetical protein
MIPCGFKRQTSMANSLFHKKGQNREERQRDTWLPGTGMTWPNNNTYLKRNLE